MDKQQRMGRVMCIRRVPVGRSRALQLSTRR